MTVAGASAHVALSRSFEEIVARDARLGGFSHQNMYPSQAEATNTRAEAQRMGEATIDAVVARHGDPELLRRLGRESVTVADKSGRLAVMANQASTFGGWHEALDGPVDALRAGLAAQHGTARADRGATALIADIGASISNVSRQAGIVHGYSNRDVYPSQSMSGTVRQVADDMADVAVNLALLDGSSAGTAQRILDGAQQVGASGGRMAIMANHGVTFGSWSNTFDDAIRALQDGLEVAARLR